MHRVEKQKGFTLLEVMIALLVFSMGLLGMAGLLTLSVKTTHVAYQRTQASFLAQAMADRMRANVMGIWSGKYAVTGAATSPTLPWATDCTAATCSVADVAKRDLEIWDYQLSQFLPTPTRTIKCPATGYAAPAPTPTADQLVLLPPYGSFCEVDITWNEAGVDRDIAVNKETLTWVFQP
jgi:type IV pilus assembly protein PilV